MIFLLKTCGSEFRRRSLQWKVFWGLLRTVGRMLRWKSGLTANSACRWYGFHDWVRIVDKRRVGRWRAQDRGRGNGWDQGRHWCVAMGTIKRRRRSVTISLRPRWSERVRMTWMIQAEVADDKIERDTHTQRDGLLWWMAGSSVWKRSDNCKIQLTRDRTTQIPKMAKTSWH